jgi:hypothetical protein
MLSPALRLYMMYLVNTQNHIKDLVNQVNLPKLLAAQMVLRDISNDNALGYGI